MGCDCETPALLTVCRTAELERWCSGEACDVGENMLRFDRAGMEEKQKNGGNLRVREFFNYTDLPCWAACPSVSGQTAAATVAINWFRSKH